jgi:hypothetical protein
VILVSKSSPLKDEVIVIISSISWNMEWQGHQRLTFWWARHAKKVIYIDNMPKRLPAIREFKRVAFRINPLRNSNPKYRKHRKPLDKFRNVEVFTPLVLPSVNKLFNWVNNKFYLKKLSNNIKKKLKGQKPIAWCLLPSTSAQTIIDYLEPKVLIYNCVDNYQAGRDAPKELAEIENDFIKNSDIVAVGSEYLFKEKSKIRQGIYLIPYGVNYELMHKAHTGFYEGNARRVCFFGGVNRQRINIGIINALGKAGIEVWIIGTVRDFLPRLNKNVRLIPAVEHEQLPGLLAECDCLILPYNINEFTDGIMPSKIYECFASGKPIISTPLKNLKKFKDVIIMAESGKDFVYAARNIGKFDNREKYIKRLNLAMENSEDNMYNSFIQPIVDIISKKKLKSKGSK